MDLDQQPIQLSLSTQFFLLSLSILTHSKLLQPLNMTCINKSSSSLE